MSEREGSQEDVSECGAVRERESAWESERVCVHGSELRTRSQKRGESLTAATTTGSRAIGFEERKRHESSVFMDERVP